MVTTALQNSDLPPLSDRESHLLAAFIRLNFSIFKLAEEEHLLPRELLAFTESAAIQTHLDQLKTFSESALSLRAIASKNQALDHLQKVAATTENLVEKRRAASAMLRILCARTTLLASAAERTLPSSPPGGGGSALRAGGGSVSTPPTKPPRANAHGERAESRNQNSSFGVSSCSTTIQNTQGSVEEAAERAPSAGEAPAPPPVGQDAKIAPTFSALCGPTPADHPVPTSLFRLSPFASRPTSSLLAAAGAAIPTRSRDHP